MRSLLLLLLLLPSLASAAIYNEVIAYPGLSHGGANEARGNVFTVSTDATLVDYTFRTRQGYPSSTEQILRRLVSGVGVGLVAVHGA